MTDRRLPKILFLGAGMAAACMMATGSTAAVAAPVDVHSLPLAKANPDVSVQVIRSLPASVTGRSDLRIDSSIKTDTPLLMTDGRIVPGQSPQKVAAAKSCRRLIVAPIGAGWSKALDSPCGFIGTSDTAKITYTFTRDPASEGTACFQALGNKKVNVAKPPLLPKYQWQKVWNGAGCTTGGKTFLWGNVAGVPSVKVKAAGIIGWAGQFAH